MVRLTAKLLSATVQFILFSAIDRLEVSKDADKLAEVQLLFVLSAEQM